MFSKPPTPQSIGRPGIFAGTYDSHLSPLWSIPPSQRSFVPSQLLPQSYEISSIDRQIRVCNRIMLPAKPKNEPCHNLRWACTSCKTYRLNFAVNPGGTEMIAWNTALDVCFMDIGFLELQTRDCTEGGIRQERYFHGVLLSSSVFWAIWLVFSPDWYERGSSGNSSIVGIATTLKHVNEDNQVGNGTPSFSISVIWIQSTPYVNCTGQLW